jgi:hypothetical protein
MIMRRKMTMMDTLYWLNMCENYENYENYENDDDDDGEEMNNTLYRY